jgi:hypothetical protein
VELDALFGDSSVEAVEEQPAEEHEGIGWKVLALFLCGALVITALAVAFMVWVIQGLVL